MWYAFFASASFFLLQELSVWESPINCAKTIEADVLPFCVFLTCEASHIVETFANLGSRLGQGVIGQPFFPFLQRRGQLWPR